jgi:alkylhydroperoxidase family enzyme
MPRIEPMTPPYTVQAQNKFDSILPPGRVVPTLFRILAKSDRAWDKQIGGSLMSPGPLPVRDREVVILRTAALNHCEYEWGIHVAMFASVATLTTEQVGATVKREIDASVWSEAERALLRAVDALNSRAGLNAREFHALHTHYVEAQVLEIIQLAGFYRTVACLANSLDLGAEPGMPTFPKSFDLAPRT